MPGRIRFLYRERVDVVLAYVDWRLQDEQDLTVWSREFDAYLRPFGRKMDLILELSHFHVNTRLAAQFADARARILADLIGRSYRVNQKPRERAMMYTARVLHGTPANHFASIDEALKALFADRAKDAQDGHAASGVQRAATAGPPPRAGGVNAP